MRGGRRQARQIEQRAAADGNDVGMAVNVIPVDLRLDFETWK